MSNTELILAALTTVLGGGSIWNWIASRGKTRVDLIQLGQTISAQIIRVVMAVRETGNVSPVYGRLTSAVIS